MAIRVGVTGTEGLTSLPAALVSLLTTEGVEIEQRSWHSIEVNGEAFISREIQDLEVDLTELPDWAPALQEVTAANLPWAEEHFLERVGGEPLNPPPSHERWPWAHSQHQSGDSQQFSHTYPERFWPKVAGYGASAIWAWIEQNAAALRQLTLRRGIRYPYGDYLDVVRLLVDDPQTRQAYLPIWFPEDTGVVHGERVPCSLGYHFMRREGRLSMRYYMRSCEYLRHFHDDLYMAIRLMQHTRELISKLTDGEQVVQMGDLHMFVASFHCMKGDYDELGIED